MSSSSSSCPCEDIGFWSVESILQCQKISDFLIALAYFSIPLELFYFVSCSTIFPFRWILLQFGAFIVLCGLTHFVAVWTYELHSFQVMLSLTVLKFLTALVSFATSITLLTLIPQMLRVMVREGLLRKKTRELNREVGKMKRQEEARLHVRRLTQEIRRSLNRHMILYTTLVELSKVFFLENCAVWMPDDSVTGLTLTYVLKQAVGLSCPSFIPLNDPDVMEVIGSSGVRILDSNSRLLRSEESGSTAAVRMPLLRVSNFEGGTPEFVDAPYALLVLVLPSDGAREWSSHDLELVEVVADQVAVALSHAAVLEDSLHMREKLMEQNLALERARREALMASRARCSFQRVMSREVAMPARSVAAVLSILQQEDLRAEQQSIVEPMVKLGLLLSTLAADVAGICNLDEGKFELDFHPFSVYSMMKEVVSILKLLCASRKVNFEFQVSEGAPEHVVGDEKRILQLLLNMVRNLLDSGDQGDVFLSVYMESGSQSGHDKQLPWQRAVSGEFVHLKFEIRSDIKEVSSNSSMQKSRKCDTEGPSLLMCQKLAQLMNGELSASPSLSQNRKMSLTIRLAVTRSEEALNRPKYNQDSGLSLLQRKTILLADSDGFSQSIIRKLLEKLGCRLSVASSWYQCLETLHLNRDEFQLLLIDLHLLEENIHEMSSRVRKLRSGSWLLVVALVSEADKETRDKCLQHGVHGVVSKPVILREMEEELQRIVHQSGAAHH
ncbi:ethylene receptor 2-like [Aristolochia californica]|uniref:ethylene receptor 2-like n=1 Tax=Aristolochia californica TaxID=171875 RepID=UPI0035E227E0